MQVTPNKVFAYSSLLATLLSGSALFDTIAHAEGPSYAENEVDRIRKYSNLVTRDKDTLYLHLKNGSKIAIKSETKCDRYETCAIFEFADYIIDKGYYLLTIGLYEGNEWMMVSDETGKKHIVHANPFLSPDRSRFVTASASEAHNINGVFIWRFETDELQSELSYEPKEYALYDFAGWNDNTTISLKKFTNSDKSFCPNANFMYVPVVLKLNKTKWEFREDRSKDKVICDSR